MHNALFGSLVTLALSAIGPPGGGGSPSRTTLERDGGAAPSIVWKGIDSGPGPIYPAGPNRPPADSPPTVSSSPDRDPPPVDPFRVGPPYPR